MRVGGAVDNPAPRLLGWGVDNSAQLFPGSATLLFGGPTNRGVRLRHAHGLGDPTNRGLGLRHAHGLEGPSSRRLGLERALDDMVQPGGWSGMVGHERSLA